MADAQRRWVLKNAEGVVVGPYTTAQIIKAIRSGNLEGDESISIYPGNDWRPISKDPQFYDYLLEALAGQTSGEVAESTFNPTPISNRAVSEKQEAENKRREAEKKAPPQEIPGEEVEVEVEEFQRQDLRTAATKTSAHQGSSRNAERKTSERSARSKRKKKKSNRSDDIELVDTKKIFRSELFQRIRVPAAFLVAVVILAYVFWPQSGVEEGGRIHLLGPRSGNARSGSAKGLSPQEQAARFKKAYAHYSRDTYQNYVSAQNELVQVIEANGKDANSIALLCMTYLELWPFAYQDSQDMKTVTQVVQLAGLNDPAGVNAAKCRAVDLILKGRAPEAKNLVEAVLESEGSQGRTPVDFYYLKAVLLAMGKEILTATSYLQSAAKLEPRRIRFFIFEAQLHQEGNDDPTAAKILKRVLEASKNHATAKVLLGISEVRHFRHYDRAEQMLKEGLNSEDRVTRELASRGYISLAEIALSRNKPKEALSYAQLAYSASPTNEVAKNLILKLGGKGKLKDTPLKALQLIYEGDQFVREGDCHAAQAHFKSAYELEKNPVAAMKAGVCLWKLSFSTEAIEWLQKAIRADPKLTEAYVYLADYYTRRFNFAAAVRTLALAQKENPKSYEVFRGYALVELRRNAPQSAVGYGKKALELYETDVETHIIMAESYMAMRDFRLGYTHAAKAVEVDSNNRQAQIVYARALAGIQGMETGIAHLTQLVQTYPLVTEYRLALGKMFAQDESYSQAENVFKQVIGIEEKPKEAYLELGKILRKTSRYAEALDALLRAAVLDPADAEPLFQAGLIYLDVKKPGEATVQFQRVLKINPSYPLVHYWLGKSALDADDANEALNQSQNERKVNPNLAEAYLLAAEAYAKLGQYSLCAQEYQKAIKLRPQGAEIYVDLARCYRLADNLDIAEAMLNQAAAQESGYAPLYRELGEVFERRGDYGRAIESYKQYFVLSPNAPDREQIEMRILNFR